jgi:hypothetical protein
VPIYFHETIDTTIVREKALMYLDKVGRSAVGLADNEKAPMRNVGKWVVNWTTGRWIEVVGLWEMSSWDWFIEHFTKTDLMLDHPEGHEQYRSGGFDRLLQPSEGTPTLREIQQQGLRAPFIMQETVEVAPGEAPKYLAALTKAADGIARSERGMRLQGAYKVLLRDEREIVTQWAFADLGAFSATASEPSGFRELQAWREEARDMERSYIAKLLEPTSWSALR